MATYAIGDLQGCYRTLRSLLACIDYNERSDHLWFVGDLVNRGEDSLECLRFVKSLGDRATMVLGNHDLHLLAVAEGLRKPGKNDTLSPILESSDREQLLAWLRKQKLFHADGNFVMVHAGLLPAWDVATCERLASEVQVELAGAHFRALLANMYGDKPDRWNPALQGMDRWRLTINAMTRLRVLQGDAIEHRFKGELQNLPAGLSPWFEKLHATFAGTTVIAGHWSALGLRVLPGFIGLDTGCVWGRQLTALRLDDRKIFQVESAEMRSPEGWD